MLGELLIRKGKNGLKSYGSFMRYFEIFVCKFGRICGEACAVLTDPDAIANGLLDLQSKLNFTGSNLDEIIGNELGEPFLLEHVS